VEGTDVKVQVVVHLELTDDEFVWWADSPDVPGFSAAAPRLKQLENEVDRLLRSEVGRSIDIEWSLASDPSDVGMAAAEFDEALGSEAPTTDAPEVRRVERVLIPA
jgi:hypothetical protein